LHCITFALANVSNILHFLPVADSRTVYDVHKHYRSMVSEWKQKLCIGNYFTGEVGSEHVC